MCHNSEKSEMSQQQDFLTSDRNWYQQWIHSPITAFMKRQDTRWMLQCAHEIPADIGFASLDWDIKQWAFKWMKKFVMILAKYWNENCL